MVDYIAKIKASLGKPYCEGENCLIYNMDCLEGMKYLPSGMVNLTVTSPPYNIGKEYEDIIPIEAYVTWCEKWLNEIYRITRDRGALLLNVGFVSLPGKAKALPLPYLLWNKTSFFLMQEIVWNYGAGVSCKKNLSYRNEKVLWYVKNEMNYIFNLDDIRDPDVLYPYQKKNGKLRCNAIGKNPSDVWQIAKVTSGKDRASIERTEHPAQFPLDLINRIIKGFSNKGDLVMDPFMGSGTVAESCLKNDRFVLGFEIREDYCRIIADRVNSVTSVMPLPILF